MRKVGEDGVYEVFIPGVTEGMMYKYYIRTPDGRELYKADPYALHPKNGRVPRQK